MRPHYHNTIQLSEVIATLEAIEVIEVNDDTQQREKHQQDKCR